MKKFKLFLILILITNYSLATESTCTPEFVLGHYLVKRRFVVLAEVKKVKTDEFKIEILRDLKSDQNKSKSLKVLKSKNVMFTLQNDTLFRAGTKYVLFISQLNYYPRQYIYLEPCNRFIVKNDSLFIGAPFLKNLSTVDSSLRYQKNTFDDKLMSHGYKVSLNYFQELIKELNKCFVPDFRKPAYSINNYNRRRLFGGYRRTHIYGYNYYEPKSDDPFLRALADELKTFWGLTNEKPVNALD
jgi:hypothetical protein